MGPVERMVRPHPADKAPNNSLLYIASAGAAVDKLFTKDLAHRTSSDYMA